MFCVHLRLQEDETIWKQIDYWHDPYVIVLKIRAWVSDNFEILVEHKPHWYLKDPALPRLKDFNLVDVPQSL